MVHIEQFRESEQANILQWHVLYVTVVGFAAMHSRHMFREVIQSAVSFDKTDLIINIPFALYQVLEIIWFMSRAPHIN